MSLNGQCVRTVILTLSLMVTRELKWFNQSERVLKTFDQSERVPKRSREKTDKIKRYGLVIRLYFDEKLSL